MKNKTKIELFAATNCCPQESDGDCCQDEQCTCELTLHSASSENGKKRAVELGVSSYPAIAINDQLLNCPSIEKAICDALCSEEANCCCC